MIYSHSAFPSLRILSHWTVIDGLRAVKGSPHVPLSREHSLLEQTQVIHPASYTAALTIYDQNLGNSQEPIHGLP